MAISLSRAAFGATVIVVAVTLFLGYKRGLVNKSRLTSLALAALCASIFIAPLVLQHYTERFSTIEISDPTADPNTMTRAVQTFTAADEILKHPIWGGGTASFQLAFDWRDLGAEWEEQGWIGNTEMRVLHDTGIVGLLVFILFGASLAYRAWKALKLESNPELVALLASLLVYCITFQATEGTLMAFSWVHLGLISCAISVMGGGKHSIEEGKAQIASS
jgi:O-antigen ligase